MPLESTTLPGRAGETASATRLFFGCQNDAASQPAMAAWRRLVAGATGAPVDVWRPTPSCCGHPLWRWGAVEPFQRHARRVMRSLPAGVTRLVVDDPGCAKALREVYPALGLAMPEVQLAQAFLPQARGPTADGRTAPIWHAGGGPWAPHDACWSRGQPGGEPLRSTMPQAMVRGGSVLEGEAGCCGGMLLPLYDPELAATAAQRRAEDLLGGGATRIVSASPTCSRRLRAVGAPVDDVATLLR